jgi:circadian clock protein KaiC
MTGILREKNDDGAARPTADPMQGERTKAKFGIEGLDSILNGGIERNRLYLVEGNPGTGKTTMAVQFLIEGVRRGEPALYITLSETEEELRATARAHNWVLDGITICELVPPESLLDEAQQQSLLYSSDLELGETTRAVFDIVGRLKPSRVVVDSLSEIRLLAQSSLRYRRQMLGLKHFLSRHDCTALLLDDMTAELSERTVHSIAHGVLHLEELSPLYGSDRRRMRVTKLRGQAYRGGYHDFAIVEGGVRVFPRLVASEHFGPFPDGRLQSGIATLDELLGGGLDRGTSTLLIGPSGTGKTLMALVFAAAAVRDGRRAAMFVLDEDIRMLVIRAAGIGLDLGAMQASGHLVLQQIDPAELSPGEFAHRVRHVVEIGGATTVVIDSLNGYNAAMPEEQFLMLHMHELLSYLGRRGVVSLLTMAQQGVTGDMRSPVDVTYLADAVILLRFFEASGEVRRAVSIIKKRSGPHEDTIRELRVTAAGIEVGAPLRHFQGILRGTPTYAGPAGLEMLGHGR